MTNVSGRTAPVSGAGAAEINVANGMLARLTAAKGIGTTGTRWMAFFLPTLVVALSSSTEQLTTILGVGEMVGVVMIFVGRYLDRDRELATIVFALVLASSGMFLATAGRLVPFAIGYLIVMLGGSAMTVASHTYLGRRIRYERRSRAIGILETSWALSMLMGVPVAAVLISLFGWRGPLVVYGSIAAIIAFLVWTYNDQAVVLHDAAANPAASKQPLNSDAWMAIATSSSIAICGLTTVVIAGTWLHEAFGMSIEGVGVIALLFGAAELIASLGSAAFADRVGPNRSTRVAMVIVLVGLAVITQAGSSLPLGALGLFLFFVGFEFSIVTSFNIVAEAMPTARGRVLARNTGVSTVLRGLGVSLSGFSYGIHGIVGPATISITAGILAVTLLTAIAARQNRG